MAMLWGVPTAIGVPIAVFALVIVWPEQVLGQPL